MEHQRLTVLFADLADSTKLYQTAGDVAAHQRVTDSLQAMKLAVERHDGSLLRTIGDAVLASFTHTDAAFLAAVDIQREHLSRSLSVRVGFHFGEVIPDAGDVYGNTVNIAARVSSFAQANEIFTTEDTVAQLSIKYRSRAFYMDTVDFKGIEQPMPVYRVQWIEDDSETAIVTALSRTKRYQTATVLNLVVGARRIQLNESNPNITFGRSPDNDVIIDIDSASRNHARIELIRGRYILQDSSTNGTYMVRGNLLPEFVRRESRPLDGSGIIGLGFIPEDNNHSVIEYSLSRE